MPVIATDVGHSHTGANVDPFSTVHPGDQLTHLFTEHRCQRCRLRFDQHHVDTELSQARGHLAADESGADDHRLPRGSGVFTQCQCVVEGSQHPDAGQIGD